MATTTFIDASELDFTSYKEKLKTFLKSQDRFKDYDFDGSDISVMLDLLAFNTYQNGFMLNMTGSEMFQDTAVMRESVVSHAKELNYVPRSRTSSIAAVDVSISPIDQPSLIVIPKFYSFVSQSPAQNRSYIFSTNEAITIRNNGGEYLASNVAVYEGRVVTEYFTANTSSRFLISSANCDISSLDVNVQASRTDTSNTTFTKAEKLYGLSGESDVYFLQGAERDQYEILFGNGVIGRKLSDGNVVKITYRDCSGAEGDGLTRFAPAGTIDGYANINVSTTQGQKSSGGGEREDVESIRFNAPRHYAVQGSAINADDYVTMVRENFPSIQTVTVFGGEELPQKRYGKVVVAAKPFGGQFVTNALKSSIINYLSDRNSVEIDPIFLDPDFFYAEVTSNVYYFPDNTSKTTNDMESTINDAIMKYSNSSLSDFKKSFLLSRLSNAIDRSDASIDSNDTSVRFVKRIAPVLGIAQTIIIDFSTPLSVSTRGVNTVESSYFTYTVQDVNYTAYIADDGNGKLNIYTQGADNKDIILVSNIGKVNYAKGSIVTNPLFFTDYRGYINFYVRTVSRDLKVTRNQILQIDPVDISVNLFKA